MSLECITLLLYNLSTIKISYHTYLLEFCETQTASVHLILKIKT